MSADKLDGVEHAARERFEADARYNDALTALDAAIVAAAREFAPSREQLERITTALIIFLQQITAFVETKDRELSAKTSSCFPPRKRRSACWSRSSQVPGSSSSPVTLRPRS